jgi:Domain of unknown function (DUF4279)
MSRTIGYFSLSGNFDPDEITQQLGIEPSWAHRIGDPGPLNAVGPRLGAEWCLATDEDAYGDVADQIIFLLDRLKWSTEAVASLASKFTATFKLAAYLDSNYPSWFLSSEFVRQLAALNVDLDCKYIYANTVPIKEPEIAN